MATLKSASKLADRLAKIVRSTEGLPRVSVGFLRGATYPDGTPVALVAATNEFGVAAHNQPPRPFFRLMVANDSPGWPAAIATNMKALDYDAKKTLDRMGQGIKGQIQDSIQALTSPPLAPSTVKRKGFDKPLVDTGHMASSIDYRVED